MAYGTPALARRASRRYYTHIRRGRPPEPQLLDELARPLQRHRRARRRCGDHRGPGGLASASALGEGWAVALGNKHARAVHRGRRRRSSPTAGVPPGRRRGAGPALQPGIGRRVRGPPRDGRRRARHRPAATVEHVGRPRRSGVDFQARAVQAEPWPRCPTAPRCCFTAHSLPGAGARRRPLPRAAARPRPRPSPPRAGARPLVGLGAGLAVGRPHRRSVAGPRHPRGARRPRRHRPGATACSCARRASWPTTSRCSTTSTSQAAERAAAARPRLRPHPQPQRRRRRARRARRVACR